MRALKCWIAGFMWVRYIRTTPGKTPPMWAIRWALDGTPGQRERIMGRTGRAVRRGRK